MISACHSCRDPHVVCWFEEFTGGDSDEDDDEARENPVNKLPLQVAAGEAPLQDRTVIMKVVRFDRSTTRSFGVLRRRLCYWPWCWWCSALGLSDLAAAEWSSCSNQLGWSSRLDAGARAREK